MALAIDYRPKTLSDVKGNESVKKSLTALLKRNPKDIPKCFMFSGLSGGGKTTLARIVAKELGCVDSEFYELNSANVRGIDTVRELEKLTRYAPMDGTCRIWLIDECFAAGTMISTPSGDVPIEDVETGDSVFSIAGNDRVVNKFENKVELERVAKVSLKNGETIYCSTNHKFLTTNGWKMVYKLDLQKDLLLPYSRLVVNDIIRQKESRSANTKTIEKMRNMRERVHLQKNTSKNVQSRVQSQTESQNEGNRTTSHESLSYLSKRVSGNGVVQQEEVLQSEMQRQRSFSERRNAGANSHQSIGFEDCRFEGEVSTDGSRGDSQGETFSTNVEEQSVVKSSGYSKSHGDKKTQRDSECVVGCSGWKRTFDGSSDGVGGCVRVADRICNIVRFSDTELSDVLQSGHSTTETETCNRSGWKRSQYEKKYIKRCKKDEQTNYIGVESVEIYKQGYNDESFRSIIDDTERDKGFVIFYDMEMSSHPSYFANGVTVHNCHMQTSAAQQAMLKMFEECPKHVYFMIATTNPEKVIPALKGRCISFEVLPLDDEEMYDMLMDIIEGENANVPDSIIDKIVSNAGGSSRNAIQFLEKVIDLEPKEMEKVVMKMGDEEAVTKDLFDALINKKQWKEVASIIKRITVEAESIRYSMLGLSNSMLLGGYGNPKQAALVLECFSKNTYDTGKNGITLAAYGVICG